MVLVGLEDSLSEELAGEEGFDVQRTDDIEGLDEHRGADAVLIALEGSGPLEVLGALRARAPEAAVLVVTDPDREADGAVALHGGAEDHLVRGSIPDGFLSRAIRYAIAQRRLRRELSTTDEITGLPNLRGFAPIAEHHLRMADRAKTQVVFVFMRLDGLQAARAAGPEEAEVLVREAANVLLEAVRDADVPARITEDTFAVLLTGDAVGAETLVLVPPGGSDRGARHGPADPTFALAVGRQCPVRPGGARHPVADPRDGRPPPGRSTPGGVIQGLMRCEYPATERPHPGRTPKGRGGNRGRRCWSGASRWG